MVARGFFYKKTEYSIIGFITFLEVRNSVHKNRNLLGIL